MVNHESGYRLGVLRLPSPIEALTYPPRILSESILWITNRVIPPTPELPRIGSSITIFEGGLDTSEETAK